jgi:hypothetical protein
VLLFLENGQQKRYGFARSAGVTAQGKVRANQITISCGAKQTILPKRHAGFIDLLLSPVVS